MSGRWTKEEEIKQRKLLENLYIEKNLTIFQVAAELNIAYQTVFSRLKRLGIKSTPYLKSNYTHKRNLIDVSYSRELAEFIGIMYGDGHISEEQVFVILGTKESKYANYIIYLFEKLFGHKLKTYLRSGISGNKHIVLYLGFVELVRFLRNMGLVSNKVKEQVSVPRWIFTKQEFMRGFIRGFFDTDGSVYKLRWGNQISFCNRSLRLLDGIRKILIKLGFSPSKISIYNLYLTRKLDLIKFYKEVGSNNPKKLDRLKAWVGTEVAKPGTL